MHLRSGKFTFTPANKRTHDDSQGYTYLSGNWHNMPKDVMKDLDDRGLNLYDWESFKEMSLRDNAVEAVDAVRNCRQFAAVFCDPGHRYPGTFELMSMALALGKPVVVYVDFPVRDDCYVNGRKHSWGCAFDRFMLYHPEVRVFVAGQYEKFVECLCDH